MLKKYYSCDQINENEIGETYRKCGGEEEYVQGFGEI